ncbi:MAG: cysteine desulfurase-like protein [Saprospiraceae bacterium]
MNLDFRTNFPALSRQYRDKALIFLDGPAGVQVPRQVIDAISNYYAQSNANAHGVFLTSRETDAILDRARLLMAAFIGAEGPETISFGQNMTSLNFALARAVGRSLQPGDEILITQLDHEGNRGPWLSLRERGIVVREVRLKPEGVLDEDDLIAKVNERTRLIAAGFASNLLGTVNDLQLLRRVAHAAGAWLLVDAVHAAPHFPVRATEIGCDFLLCSAYKFYGPHVGILYARQGLLDRLQPDRLRTAYQHAPYAIETGTLNHAAIAGVAAAVEFLAEQGEGADVRARLATAMQRIQDYEAGLMRVLYEGLAAIPGVVIHGLPPGAAKRAPTLALSVEGKTPEEVCHFLANENIFAWHGHFYAIRAIEVLGLLEKGGVTRLGISAYTTRDEIEAVIRAFRKIT